MVHCVVVSITFCLWLGTTTKFWNYTHSMCH